MDDFELEDIEDEKPRPSADYKPAKWRPKVGRRMIGRVKLIAAWLYITILPHYGLRAFVSMILITCGRLADAASFVVGTHILTRSLSQDHLASGGLQVGLAWAAAGMAGVLTIASILSYIGAKMAVQISKDYEKACLVQGISIIHFHNAQKMPLSKEDSASITQQAPRAMSRSLMQGIHACTSLVMMGTGLSTCLFVFPVLTLLVIASLILVSPAYIYAAIHSTNIGHSMRHTTQGYGGALGRLQKKWLKAKTFDSGEVLNEISADQDYRAFQEAHSARLNLSARNHLLSNLTLALVVALSFIWIANEVELNTSTIASVVSFLVSLRLFAHGLAGIFQGVQNVNASLPFYLTFLMRDPRFAKFR